ncbi:MFS transporter [Streptomyces sp. GTA36]|uniref:MFS transporter n=1 Tax=Streptomyces sp. 2-1 TaxID=412710 RepID=UPI003AFAB369
MTGRARNPYRSVAAHPRVRWILPAVAVSSLGDGMAEVAVIWLALRLAPPGGEGWWVAAAAGAYTLPGAVGTLVLGRFVRRRDPVLLAAGDAALRAVALTAVAGTYLLGALTPALYVLGLGLSSVLHAWGQAGLYGWLAGELAEEDRLAGNATLSGVATAAALGGPLLAAALLARTDAALVLALDGGTFAVLAVALLAGRRRGPSRSVVAERPRSPGHPAAALSLIVLGAVVLLFFGAVYVMLPLLARQHPGGGSTFLAVLYTAFTVGALVGSGLSGFLDGLPPRLLIAVLTGAFALSLAVLGLPVPEVLTVVSFAVSGLLWSMYSTVSITLLQRTVEPSTLVGVLALNSSARLVALPVGYGLGGLLVSLTGLRPAILLAALSVAGAGWAMAACARDERTRAMVEQRDDATARPTRSVT